MNRQPQTSKLWIFALVLVVGFCCCALVLVVGLVYFIPTTPATPITPITPTPPTLSEEVLVVTGSGSVTISSGVAGIVTTDSGAQLEIPNGAVPPAEDGSPGTAEFRLEVDSSSAMVLSAEFSQIGPIYRLMPEGAAFGMPVKLTLPIPNDVEAKNVFGVATFDDFSGTWQLLPAVVNEQAHTVVIEVGHFSNYGIFGHSDYFESGEIWANRNGGWFSILNTHRDGGELAPFGKPLPASVYYGVCVQELSYDDPLVDTWNWRPPTDWMIGATALKLEDFRVKRWLPAGTYTLMEFYGIGETNNKNAVPHNLL